MHLLSFKSSFISKFSNPVPYLVSETKYEYVKLNMNTNVKLNMKLHLKINMNVKLNMKLDLRLNVSLI